MTVERSPQPDIYSPGRLLLMLGIPQPIAYGEGSAIAAYTHQNFAEIGKKAVSLLGELYFPLTAAVLYHPVRELSTITRSVPLMPATALGWHFKEQPLAYNSSNYGHRLRQGAQGTEGPIEVQRRLILDIDGQVLLPQRDGEVFPHMDLPKPTIYPESTDAFQNRATELQGQNIDWGQYPAEGVAHGLGTLIGQALELSRR